VLDELTANLTTEETMEIYASVSGAGR